MSDEWIIFQQVTGRRQRKGIKAAKAEAAGNGISNDHRLVRVHDLSYTIVSNRHYD